MAPEIPDDEKSEVLDDDRLGDDYPPDQPQASEDYGLTGAEQRHKEPLDERIGRDEPDHLPPPADHEIKPVDQGIPDKEEDVGELAANDDFTGDETTRDVAIERIAPSRRKRSVSISPTSSADEFIGASRMPRLANIANATADLATSAATALRRRLIDKQSSQPNGQDLVAITVVGSVDEVTKAWSNQPPEWTDAAFDVSFDPAPGGRGTEIRVTLQATGSDGNGVVERLRGESPVQRIREGLRRFKAMMECDEVITTQGQPSGRGPVQERVTRAVTDRLRAWGSP